MNLTIDELVRIVVTAVVEELARRGISVEQGAGQARPISPPASSSPAKVHIIDMSGFRSPVLLERQLLSLPKEVKEIAVPERTVVTPGARELLKRKNLILKKIPTTN
jgi:hypothetical protein